MFLRERERVGRGHAEKSRRPPPRTGDEVEMTMRERESVPNGRHCAPRACVCHFIAADETAIGRPHLSRLFI